ncbi:hypothetical protein NA56DRAFT_94186 [Hyaloscypha hepaticicola]|uniref:C2H2-type domain-containing protein n=1 Tax=Hyaloscypha hepaticicola TaxID=2082293 RepID=A0A2J6Q8R3_9HELO|nr:hypothetical protein NA56DRAFT_94186 [Hyaloscypha hepaticicola]
MFTSTTSFTSNSTPLFNIAQPISYSTDSIASMQEQQTEQHHSNLSLETRSSTNFDSPLPLLNQAQPPYPPQNYVQQTFLQNHANTPGAPRMRTDAVPAPPPKEFRCGSCNKSCKNMYELRRHEARHTYHCRFGCVKTYPRRGSLKKHEKLHCTFCGTLFPLRSSAREHEKGHLTDFFISPTN